MESKILKYNNVFFENYTISEDGIITNLKTGKTYKQTEGQNGYFRFSIHVNNKWKYPLVHKALFESFNPDLIIPQGYQIHHKNGNKSDNSLTNLELVSATIHPSLSKKALRRFKYFAKIPGVSNILEINNVSKFCKKIGVNAKTVYSNIIKDCKCTTLKGIEFYREEIIGEN